MLRVEERMKQRILVAVFVTASAKLWRNAERRLDVRGQTRATDCVVWCTEVSKKAPYPWSPPLQSRAKTMRMAVCYITNQVR